MRMGKRIREARTYLNLRQQDLEDASNGEIDKSIWGNLERGKQRVNEEVLKVMEKVAPQFIYWIVTEKTLPESGQISPEIAKKCEELNLPMDRTGWKTTDEAINMWNEYVKNFKERSANSIV